MSHNGIYFNQCLLTDGVGASLKKRGNVATDEEKCFRTELERNFCLYYECLVYLSWYFNRGGVLFVNLLDNNYLVLKINTLIFKRMYTVIRAGDAVMRGSILHMVSRKMKKLIRHEDQDTVKFYIIYKCLIKLWPISYLAFRRLFG